MDLCWDPPPAEQYNGQLTSYTIEVKDQNGDEARPPLTANGTSKRIDDLQPNTKYTFEVSTMTAAGSGPPASIEKCTTEGVKMGNSD